MDNKTRLMVEKIMQICKEGMTVGGSVVIARLDLEWEDFEDTFNKVYAEIKQLRQHLVNATLEQEDVGLDHYKEE